ncbi:sugar ABC transporter ATP-binding protein [Sinorhizobium meliloti]|uniref:sugar ABC transporter ATP-binding protein n=1 Tax=Rhizobium meliloti TaxID=382 RepID=UPI00037D06C7|nr:sugar ABC transporter ATP-binding protein [Sinorhizobium meliloti]
MTPLLQVRNLRRTYGPVVALNGVSLELRVGEVLGLIGQNGSGKSTLMKILAGLEQPDGGDLLIEGNPVRLKSSADAVRFGIGMVHQEQSLLPNLTVAENIFLDKPHPSKRGGLYRWSALEAAARKQLEKIKVDISPSAVVEDLSFAERQQVELAKVLAIEEVVNRPPVILLDEPTSVLTPDEIELLFQQVNRLRQRAAIIFISHRLEEILHVCDRAIVLTNGNLVAERRGADTDRHELFELMVGRRHNTAIGERSPTTGRKVLEVKNLAAGDAFSNVSFDLKGGEILGIAGVQGSGGEELCRAIFGAEAITGGSLELEGNQLSVVGPRDAIRNGIGYLPSNRRLEGMLRGRSLVENMAVTFGLEYGKGNVILDRRSEGEVARNWLQRLKVKTPSPYVNIEALSGGNQQKVVMGKWLMGKRLKVLLLDHPTRGLDPGAREDLFAAIRDSASRGLVVVFVGDTTAEILELSHKVLVMKDGRVAQKYDLAAGDRPSEGDIVAAMV